MISSSTGVDRCEGSRDKDSLTEGGLGGCNQEGGRITEASYQIDQGKIICAGERPRLCAINAVYEQ